MTEKLSEWLDQYNDISQRQQDYLTRIHDLRRSLQNRDEKRIVVTIDNMRAIQKQRYRRKFPVYTMSKMEDTANPQGPAPFPNRPCLFHTEEGHREQKIKIAPRAAPRKLAPIVKKVKGSHIPKQIEVASSEGSTPRPEMSKMRTEYEPFESIARRNKLSLTQFFNSSLSHRRTNRRQPLNVSTVTIINEVAEENERAPPSPLEFITDLSSRKSMASKIRDSKPD